MPYRPGDRSPASAVRAPARRPLPIIAVLGLVLALLFALALLLAGPGHRWQLWDYRTGFAIMRWSAIGGLVAAFMSMLGAVVVRPGTGRRGFALTLLGIMLGISVAAVPWWLRRSAQAAPPIHDVTTDLQSPPSFVAVLPLRAGAPNSAEYGGAEIAAQQREAYPDIQPVLLDVPPAQAFDVALTAATDLGWEIVAADSTTGRIEASDRTFWFGFADDVVVRITPSDAGSRVDVRSVSRVGRGDAGTNGKRIRRFSERLRQGTGG